MNSDISVEETAGLAVLKELQRREKARTNFLDYIRFIYPDYEIEERRYDPEKEGYVEFLANRLQDCVDGKLDRLMISLPCQYGKSDQASRLFPGFWLGQFPNDPIIMTSYAASLSFDLSRDARTIIKSKEYKQLFGNLSIVDTWEPSEPERVGQRVAIELDRDKRSVQSWGIKNQRGCVFVAGVGGGITGHGARLAIIDDPIKDDKDARSDVIREEAINWYRGALYSRLAPDATVILIATRWHQSDLNGWLLEEQEEGDDWYFVKLPAIAGEDDVLGRKVGQPLCPKKHDKKKLEKIKGVTGPRLWAAMWQQEPVPVGGLMIRREWFKSSYLDPDEVPEDIMWIRCWDFAYSEKEITGRDPDYTAGVKAGLWRVSDDDIRFVIADIKRKQGSWSNSKMLVRNTAREDGEDVIIYGESGGSQKGSMDDLINDPALALHGVREVKSSGRSKVGNANPWIDRAMIGRVFLIRGAWNGPFLDEAETFPNGNHDDQCLLPDTLVPVIVDGYLKVKKASEVEIGDKLFNVCGENTKVEEVFVREYNGEIIRIKAQGATEVALTPEHPIYGVVNVEASMGGFLPRAKGTPSWIDAGDIEFADSVLSIMNCEVREVEKIDLLDYIPEEMLQKKGKRSQAGLYLSTMIITDDSISFSNPRSTPIPRFISVDEDLCRLLGYFVAEGSRGRHNVAWSFGEHELEYVEDVENLVLNIFGKKLSRTIANGSCSLSVSSWVMHSFFGLFEDGARNKAIPEWLLFLSKELQIAFLKGAWRGDGCVTKVGSFVYVSTSRHLIEALKMMLIRLGLVPQLTISRKDGHKRAIIKDRKVSFSHPLFQLTLTGKYSDVFSSMIEMPNGRENIKQIRVSDRIINGYLHRRVRRIIRERYTGKVYNFQVDKGSSYHTESFLVHNCDSVSMAYRILFEQAIPDVW